MMTNGWELNLHLSLAWSHDAPKKYEQKTDVLSKNKILSAPIRNVEAPEDASWMDKYIGIVEFAGIAMWLLSQVCNHALEHI